MKTLGLTFSLMLSFLIFSCADPPPYPECQLDQAVFEGTLDGVEVRFEFALTGHSWFNFGEAPKLTTLSENGNMEFLWSKSISYDQSDDVHGWFDTGTQKIGTCETEDAVSTITARGCFGCDLSGADFVLEGLYTDADCNGTPIEGVLYGCVRY
jgi:hypothetical protein